MELSEVIRSMYRAKSMDELGEKEYPAFMTTRELLFLVDGTLDQPFADSKPSNEDDDAKFTTLRTSLTILRPA